MIERSINIRSALRSRQRGFLLNPYRFGNAGGKVAALFHFDGPNGSTAIIDETGRSWTRNGSAQISTAQSVFGGASLLLNGSSFLTTPASPLLNMRDGAFCIEARVRIKSFSTEQTLIGNLSTEYDKSYEWLIRIAKRHINFYYGRRGSSQSILRLFTPVDLQINTWYAVAIQRDISGEWSCFVNGSKGVKYQVSPLGPGINYGPEITGVYVDAVDLGEIDNALWIGAHAFGEGFNGYIDEMRYLVGSAPYSGNYTPATEPFTYP